MTRRGRKFVFGLLICLSVLAASTTLVLVSKLSGAEWVEGLHVIKWVSITYLTANAAQKFSGSPGDRDVGGGDP